MNKASVTYRTAGSAALKPEYTQDHVEPTPIIDFETFIPSNSQQRVYRAPLELSFSEKVASKIVSDPLLGSLNKAFIKAQPSGKANKFGFARTAAAISSAILLLILLGL